MYEDDEDVKEFEEGLESSNWKDWGFTAVFGLALVIFTTSLGAGDHFGVAVGGLLTLFLGVVNAVTHGAHRKEKQIASKRKEKIKELKKQLQEEGVFLAESVSREAKLD